MALSVCLVLLDVTRGSLRNTTVAWLSAATLVFCFFGGVSFVSLGVGGYLSSLEPMLFLTPILVVLLLGSLRAPVARMILPWLGVALCALLTWPGHVPPYGIRSVAWFWQVALVGSGMLLAAGPLLAATRKRQPLVGQCHDAQHVPDVDEGPFVVV